MARPGERQIEDGREYKKATGSSPNGVANSWLAARRGREVRVVYRDELLVEGELVGFDSYSLEVRLPYDETALVFKGPGIVIFAL